MNPEHMLDTLLSLPGMHAPQVSRDGKWVAWTWFRTGPAADVFAAPTDGSTAPRRLTQTNDDTYLVSWTPDSRAVLVEQDRDGNERASLFRVDLDRPLDMVLLTEAEPNYFLRGGQLHPNGHWLVYGANLDPVTGQEIEPTCLYRHDLDTGQRTLLARPLKATNIAPDLSPAGTHVLYRRSDLDPAGRQVWLVDIDGHQDREILNFGASTKTFASWFPDGQRLLVMVEMATHRRLGIWDLASGALRWLLDDPARNIEAAYVPHGSQRIVVVEIKRARVRSSFLDPETGAESPVPAIPSNLVPLAPVEQRQWLGQLYSARQPADVVRFSPASPDQETVRSLSRVWERTTLTPEDLVPAEEWIWTSDDGLQIQGWLYRAGPSARGTILYVHGGPSAHSQDKLNNQIQFLVRQRFNVLDPNYRGSTGFGLDFREAIKAEGFGGQELVDLRTGIRSLIAAGIAQPGKVGITGTSYGGYLAWCAITHFPTDLVAAAAPICGMTDLVVDYETTRPDLRTLSEEMMGGSPLQVPSRYQERSPVHFVDRIRGHLLIVQGLQDPNVTPENVRTVTQALERAGVPYEILEFADEGHGISKPTNQKILYLRLQEFFVRAFEAQGL